MPSIAAIAVPVPVLIVTAIAVGAWFRLSDAPLGDYLFAVGGNEEATRVSGVPIGLTKVSAYAINEVVSAVAGRAACRRSISCWQPV